VPDDLPPGIYSVQVAVPNVSGIPALGDPILSNFQFVRVVLPPTARFEISGETLRCREETSPALFGSDEVRVHVLAVPITIGPDSLVAGDAQEFESDEFEMDTGDQRDLKKVLFSHQQPIDGVILMIHGFEIDSEKAYREQINDFTTLFKDYLKIVVSAVLGVGGGAIALVKGLEGLLKLALAHVLLLVIAGVVVLAISAVLALWAPADPLIEDAIGLTTTDLAALTSAEFPAPDASTHTSAAYGIRVEVSPIEKIPTQYREHREYIGEDSRYELVLRYNRVA